MNVLFTQPLMRFLILQKLPHTTSSADADVRLFHLVVQRIATADGARVVPQLAQHCVHPLAWDHFACFVNHDTVPTVDGHTAPLATKRTLFVVRHLRSRVRYLANERPS
jgi:hypothetical protein